MFKQNCTIYKVSIREGQVISDELFIHYDIKKPIYRLLLNEWTEDEVKKGMSNLKLNSEMKSLQDAGSRLDNRN